MCISPPLEGRGRGGVFGPKVILGSQGEGQTPRIFNVLRQFVVSKRCVRISPPLEGRGRGGVFDPKVILESQGEGQTPRMFNASNAKNLQCVASICGVPSAKPELFCMGTEFLIRFVPL